VKQKINDNEMLRKLIENMPETKIKKIKFFRSGHGYYFVYCGMDLILDVRWRDSVLVYPDNKTTLTNPFYLRIYSRKQFTCVIELTTCFFGLDERQTVSFYDYHLTLLNFREELKPIRPFPHNLRKLAIYIRDNFSQFVCQK
jgi:hypothetical protein